MVDQAFIDKIVARVLALLSGHPIQSSAQHVLMVFSGASTGFVVGMEAIRRLANSQHDLTVVMTPSAGHIITPAQVTKAGATKIIGPGDWADAPALVKQTDLILIPTLSMNTATRLALGLMDSLLTTLVLGSLLAGKAVVAVKDGADPDGNGGRVFGAVEGTAPALRAKLAEHLASLAAYGVELVSEGDFLLTVEQRLLTGAALPTGVKNGPLSPGFSLGAWPAPVGNYPSAAKSNIVTEIEVRTLPPGSVVRLAPGSRLTPQAQDTARRLDLKLVFE